MLTRTTLPHALLLLASPRPLAISSPRAHLACAPLRLSSLSPAHRSRAKSSTPTHPHHHPHRKMTKDHETHELSVEGEKVLERTESGTVVAEKVRQPPLLVSLTVLPRSPRAAR